MTSISILIRNRARSVDHIEKQFFAARVGNLVGSWSLTICVSCLTLHKVFISILDLSLTSILVGVTIAKGVVFDIKKYATDDGPGIRTTVFLKGCPLRCSWCHNPEGQLSTPELIYRKKKCVTCGECAKICPTHAITFSKRLIRIDRELCNLCGKCSDKCPTDAISIAGKEMTVGEVMREIEKDMPFYEESNGGVTISGGEPLMQLGFLADLLEECKKKNIHTAVDTCGYASKEAFDKIVDKVDVFLYDVKLTDNKRHKRYTGVSNKVILKNFERLARNGNSILVRLPIIPGINDDDENVSRTGHFLRRHDTENIHVLPYHRAGIEKYKSLGRAYKLKNIRSPSDEELRLIKKKLEVYGLKVRIGGG
jgi:pyruvate formate lyase activating enzyme